MLEQPKDYFDIFKQLERQQERRGEVITETVFKYSGVKLAAGDWSERGGTLYFKVNPLKKSQILLKQILILRDLEQALGRTTPKHLG